MNSRCLAFVEVNFFFKQVADVLNLCNLCGPDIVLFLKGIGLTL